MEEIASNVDRLIVMNHGTVAMSGAPRDVFARSKELISMGLDVPQVTQVFLKLRDMGLLVDPSVYTVEQARDALLAMKEGR